MSSVADFLIAEYHNQQELPSHCTESDSLNTQLLRFFKTILE